MVHGRPLHLGAAERFARLEVSAPLRTEALAPKAELSRLERTLLPRDHAIKVGSAELDVLPPSDAQVCSPSQ